MRDGAARWKRGIRVVTVVLLTASLGLFAFAPGGAQQMIGEAPQETTGTPAQDPQETQAQTNETSPPAFRMMVTGEVCDVYASIVTGAGLEQNVTVTTETGETVNLSTVDVATAAAGLVAKGQQPFGPEGAAVSEPVDATRAFSILAGACHESAGTTTGPTGPTLDRQDRDRDSGSLLDQPADEFFGGGILG